MVRIGQLSTLNSRQPDSLHLSYLRRFIQTPLDPPNFTLSLRLALSNPKAMLRSYYHGYSHNNPLPLKKSLSSRIERRKLRLKEPVVFPSRKVLRQITLFHQNLGSRLIAAPNHSTIQDLLRFRQKLRSFANDGHSGSDGAPCGQTSLEKKHIEDRVNLQAFWQSQVIRYESDSSHYFERPKVSRRKLCVLPHCDDKLSVRLQLKVNKVAKFELPIYSAFVGNLIYHVLSILELIPKVPLVSFSLSRAHS